MKQTEQAVAVLGAGSYGSALAIALARNGINVTLWGHNAQHMAVLQQQRCNQAFLPGIPFPDSLQLASDLAEVVASHLDLLLVVPSHVFADVLQQIYPYLTAQHRLAWATKGLEVDTGRLLSEVAQDIVPVGMPLAVISGPTFAKELAAGLPTAITVASTDLAFTQTVQQWLHADNLRAYYTADFIGVQLGGAVKNVIAIGAGIADGMGFGANARTALITRGLAEMMRLGRALQASEKTFMGMAGLGDLVLTCTDNQSRNRRFGLLLGQGLAVETAMAQIGQVVEGYRNTKEVWLLAQRYQVEMPITEQIYQVLYQQQPAQLAAQRLLAREHKQEFC